MLKAFVMGIKLSRDPEVFAVGFDCHLCPSVFIGGCFCLRSSPVISSGFDRLRRESRVGATSRKVPPSRSVPLKVGSTSTKGTGLVVCAVWGSPVS